MSAGAVQIIESPEVFDRLEVSSQWAALTESQRIWVVEFLASGSALLATKVGYKAKSEKNARILSYELAKNPTIVAALDVAAGRVSPVKTEREILISIVRKQIRAAEPGSVAAQKLVAQLERLQLGIKMGRPEIDDEDDELAPKRRGRPPKAQASEPSEAPKFHVGQLVTERDSEGVLHTGQVLSVDADGHPLDIKEIQ